MTKGAYDQFIVKDQTIASFLSYYDYVLYEHRFKITQRYGDHAHVRMKAIFGDKAQAFIMSHVVPFGSWLEEGNRYGAEAEITQWGPDVFFRLYVVPYMSIFDEHDYFLLTQGIVEKILDDDRCRVKLGGIVSRLMQWGLVMYTYR